MLSCVAQYRCAYMPNQPLCWEKQWKAATQGKSSAQNSADPDKTGAACINLVSRRRNLRMQVSSVNVECHRKGEEKTSTVKWQSDEFD